MKPIEATVAAAVGGRPGPVAAAVGCAVRQVREALGAAIAGRAPALNEDLVVTPNDFITKWRASELKERSASQEHFIDLCRLLGEPTPADADPTGETYCFERGARRDAGGPGAGPGPSSMRPSSSRQASLPASARDEPGTAGSRT